MGPGRIIGLVLLVVGAIALVIGLNAADSPLERFSEAFTGRFTDSTTWYLIGGAAGLVLGAALSLFGARTAE